MQQVVDDTQLPAQDKEESAQKMTEEESTEDKDTTAHSETLDDSLLEVVEGEEGVYNVVCYSCLVYDECIIHGQLYR